MADQVGMVDVRGENISRIVKVMAEEEFKFKPLLMIAPSSNWTETYYQENPAELVATGEDVGIRGVSRGASFPNVDASWTKVSTSHVKWADEATIFMEDKLTDAIDVQARTIRKVARAIANDFDAYVYSTMSSDASINTAAAVAPWDDETLINRDPIRDLLTGIEYMAVDNYDFLSNGYILLSPKDYTNLMMNSKVVNNPSFKTADVVSNGVVGQIAGGKLIVSNNVAADECLMVIGKKAATYKSAVAMSSAVVYDEGIKYTIRSWMIGHIEVTDPEAIHKITNTQS